jgi:hypothetical protein
VDATTGYPWKETGPFDERQRFVMACEEADDSFAVICERFEIRAVRKVTNGSLGSRMVGWKVCSIDRDADSSSRAVRRGSPRSSSSYATDVRVGALESCSQCSSVTIRIEFRVASTVGGLLPVNELVTKRRRRAASVG